MKNEKILRQASRAAILAVMASAPLAVGTACAEDTANAATTTATSGQTGGSTALPTVTVTGTASSNTMQAPSGFGRLPQAVEDTPQTIKVIDQKTIQQQGITSLDQALKMVPGITNDVGEGGGGMNGDQFRIRGFNAKNDIYSDGLKDFGVYVRDTFNTESVEVLIGSSGATTGRGAESGAINTTSKTPVANDFITLGGSIGSAPSARGTIDMNRMIDETTAIRLNLLYTEWDVAGRDVPKQSRFGFAPSIAFGLGTDTTLTVAYLHQQDHRVADYGIPTLATGVDFSTNPGTVSGTSGPAPVDRENWYGSDIDRDDTTADIVTIRLSHQVNDWLTITNDTRYGHYTRDFLTTVPSCSGGGGRGDPNVYPGSCLWNLYDNDPTTTPIMSFGGGNPFYQSENWGVQNVTTAIADFTVGGFKNQFVGGIDLTYEESERTNYGGQIRPGDVSLLDPYDYVVDMSGVTVNREVSGETRNYALTASDQFWFTEQFSLLAGVRWDYFEATVDDTNQARRAETDLNFFSPKASLIWQPTDSQTYYVTWAQAKTPPTASNIANEVTPGNVDREDADPTETETIEIGAKVGLFGDRLGLGVALFQTERQNVRQEDDTGVEVVLADAIKNQGIELSVTGKITERWDMQLAYTYIDSEVDDSGTAANTGQSVAAVPEHAASLWTSYRPIDPLNLGLGFTYKDGMTLNGDGSNSVPHYLSVDAMISYQLTEGASVQINGYNLLDRDDNYAQVRSGRVVPDVSRSVVFSTNVTF
ncbi:TonB-dependent siderophore receptor [Zavarzinia compransoris]|nr:TonB-dependent siderophore receptor [Zavarzinia marina]